MRELLRILQITRPHNIAAAVLCVATGHWMASGGQAPPAGLIAAVAIVTAAGNIINDYYDIDIDRINKPGRVLPSGRLSRRAALSAYLAALFVLVALFWLLPPVQSLWLAVWVVLLHLYSRYLKRRLLIGNVTVAAVTGSGFLLGAMAAGSTEAGILPAAFTFVFVLGREIVKDCEDIEGDSACGARTLPVAAGKLNASRTAAVMFLLLALSFPLPWLFGPYSRSYGLMMVIIMLPLLAASFIFTIRAMRSRLVTIMLKTGMFIGIAAFLVA